ncbi:hypothetical protein QR680_014176 [Steinernema hermaphroditum]|uniref:Uncharacterized protein n=1 Tax=Steinernema hermaphroditum TaxID=289476 RepID=A0AA39M3L3_9BILA|nr:hypothetical protein QR680_014176 [Steinernema hermaphroditum]
MTSSVKNERYLPDEIWTIVLGWMDVDHKNCPLFENVEYSAVERRVNERLLEEFGQPISIRIFDPSRPSEEDRDIFRMFQTQHIGRDDCALVAYLTVVAIGLSEKYPDDFRDTFLKKNLPALQKEYKKSKEKCISQRDYLRDAVSRLHLLLKSR